ncbi:2OG-Fe(II) oxygenase [Paenibacillus thiaminolyticus]|uniref:2OG-Fe(II) oxygenase n=1 Tax=Paenibacillus thiaminolyticus TaxID=49283 RepID=UPI0035A5EFF3
MLDRLTERMSQLDWSSVQRSLDEHGYAKLPPLLDAAACEHIIGTYAEEANFRKTIAMARYRFGIGEYKYYDAPLPPLLQQLRETLYPGLARIANVWTERLRSGAPAYPERLAEFLERCREAGQIRPTPLILKYEAGGYNCLHQDMYGDVFFPFQVVFALNRLGEGYKGGEFLLVEQRPRAQSRGHALSLAQGEGLVFPTNHRPVQGLRGYYRTAVRHGVSTVTEGTRYSLGIIFHDAK